MSAAQKKGAAQALPTLLSAIPSLPRPVLARLTARMIERLDELDGDPDNEATGAEDDFTEHRQWSLADRYAGCPIADPDSCVTDRPHDQMDEGDDEPDDAHRLPPCQYATDQRVVLGKMPVLGVYERFTHPS